MTRRRAFLAAILPGLAACGGDVPALASEPAPEGEVLAQGRFLGASGHATSGTARIVETAEGAVLAFAPDFAFDGAPDPVVGFGDGDWVAASKLGPLKAVGGAQVYALPAGFAPETYTQVYVWCERYAVPLGVAELSSP